MLRPMPMKLAASLFCASIFLLACGDGSSGDALGATAVERSTPATSAMSPLPLKDAATLARAASRPTPVVVTEDMKEACHHIQLAMNADRGDSSQGKPDWDTIEAEMYAAWRAGRDGSNETFVQRLVEPGAVAEGDTQTLGDALFSVAVMCGISVPGPYD